MTDRLTEPTCGDAGGRKADGSACGARLGLSATNGRCAFHDPERQDRVREMRAAGGRAAAAAKRAAATNRRAKIPQGMPLRPPKTLQDAVVWSAWAMHAVAIGEIDARTGHEIGYLCNAFKGALEKADLLREIGELRAQLAQFKPRSA